MTTELTGPIRPSRDETGLQNLSEYERQIYEANRPRKLTMDEINDIASVMPNVFGAIEALRVNNTRQVRNWLRRYLQEIVITPLGIPALKAEIYRQFEKSRVQPGTTVGITSAEAIGAQTSQMTLNSFHYSGAAKNVSYGVSAINELMNASVIRKHPAATIQFKDPNITFDDIYKYKRADIVGLTLNKLLLAPPTIDQPAMILGDQEPWWYQSFRLLVDPKIPYLNPNGGQEGMSTWMAELELNVDMLYAFRVTPEDIAHAISPSSGYVVRCAFSPIYTKEQRDEYLDPVTNETYVTIRQVPKAVIHVFTIDNNLQRAKALNDDSKSILTTEELSLIFLKTVFNPLLSSTLVKGVSGIKGLDPVERPILSLIRQELLQAPTYQAQVTKDGKKVVVRGSVWDIIYNKINLHITGIDRSRVKDLMVAVGITVIQENNDILRVIVPLRESFTDPVLSQANSQANEKVEKRDVLSPTGLVKYYLNIDAKDAKEYERKQKEKIKADPSLVLKIGVRRPDTPLYNLAYRFHADVEGINLITLLNREDVDPYHTYSNNMYEILFLFGVEATRSFLINDMKNVVSFDDQYVNPRHIMLLVDFMTRFGSIGKIMRSNLKTQNIQDALTEASNEKAATVLLSHASVGSAQGTKGVSSSLMVGVSVPVGTGSVNVLYDKKKAEEYLKALKEKTAERDKTAGKAKAPNVEVEKDAPDAPISADELTTALDGLVYEPDFQINGDDDEEYTNMFLQRDREQAAKEVGKEVAATKDVTVQTGVTLPPNPRNDQLIAPTPVISETLVDVLSSATTVDCVPKVTTKYTTTVQPVNIPQTSLSGGVTTVGLSTGGVTQGTTQPTELQEGGWLNTITQNLSNELVSGFPYTPQLFRKTTDTSIYNKLLVNKEIVFSLTTEAHFKQILKGLQEFAISNGLSIIADVNGTNVTDATAGGGGMVINLLGIAKTINAVELNPINFRALEHNVRLYPQQGTEVRFYNTSFLNLNLSGDILFIDPPWGGVEYEKQNKVKLYLDNKDLNDIIIDKLLSFTIIVAKVPNNYDFEAFYRVMDEGKVKYRVMSVGKDRYKVIYVTG